MHTNFIHELSVGLVSTGAASDTTEVITDVVDIQGFDSVAFIVVTGAVTNGAVLTLTGQNGDASDGGDAVDLAESLAFTADANSADNKALILDLHKPRQRYVRVKLARTIANAEVSTILAVRYNAHQCPITLEADTIAAALLNDPAPA